MVPAAYTPAGTTSLSEAEPGHSPAGCQLPWRSSSRVGRRMTSAATTPRPPRRALPGATGPPRCAPVRGPLARKRKYGGKHRHRSPFQIARADLVTAARASGDHIVNGQHSCCPDKSDTSAKEYDDAVVIIMDLVIRGTSTAIYRTVRNSCLTMPGAGSPLGSSQRQFGTRRMRLRLNYRLLTAVVQSARIVSSDRYDDRKHLLQTSNWVHAQHSIKRLQSGDACAQKTPDLLL